MFNPSIKVKETISSEDYEAIQALEKICVQTDGTALKLELDYKLGVAAEYKENSVKPLEKLNEFMYYDGDQLIGYIGIDCFGGVGAALEVNGMVHPNYRRQGIFTRLSGLVLDEWRRRNSGDLLLLCDRKASAGQAFIQKMDVVLAHAEYEMYLNQHKLSPEQINIAINTSGIKLRKATNADAKEIAMQNEIYFGRAASENEADWIMPETEEKRGLTIYLAELDGKCIGKVHLQLNGGTGGIYGLGVMPEYRGKGLGRAILLAGVEMFKAAGASEIMLQVEAQNANALGLYEACGFEVTSTMDYFKKRL